MPTRGRPHWIKQAIQSYLSQTWLRRELIIVDDEDNPSLPLGISVPGIRYERLPTRLSIGAKRNVACSVARGDIIVTFDDDDWSSPIRVEDQIRLLEANPHAVMAGYKTLIFLD